MSIINNINVLDMGEISTGDKIVNNNFDMDKI